TAVPPASCCTAARRGRTAAVITRDSASTTRARHERSSELDMPFANADRPRPEVHEQRAVGTDAPGPARRGGAELAAPQPVAPGDARTLALRARRVERGAADRRRQDRQG